MRLEDMKLAVIGLGYVGLPLAVEFGKKFPTVGYDRDEERISALKRGIDLTGEVDQQELAKASHLALVDEPAQTAESNVFIVTVPTPVDEYKRPDFGALIGASQMIGQLLRKGNIVIYESTVYPGATEEICVPVLEERSGLRFNEDFFVGYSPERMNPGDKAHTLTTITKVTSGSTPACADLVDELYASIVKAGTHKTSSIKAAEAAKVIENIQRDVNIALANELAVIFNKMGLDTLEIIEAASTKWNFLPFKPGLVGGHCIGVDPYYLTHKAQAIGYHPEVILAGRRINDQMGTYVAQRVIKLMMARNDGMTPSKVLVLGLTFKENCPDTRNTRVVDVCGALQSHGIKVDVFDPRVVGQDIAVDPGFDLVDRPDPSRDYGGIILAVAHDEFKEMGADMIRALGRSNAVFFDLKGVFKPHESDGRL